MARKPRALWTAFVIAAGAAIAIPFSALAYILPAEAILSAVTRRRSEIGFETLVAEGTYQRGDQPAIPVWEAIDASAAHRIERKGPDTEVLLTVPGKRYQFKLGEKASQSAKYNGDLVFTFYANTDKEGGLQRALAFLQARGIDENVVTLGRLDKRVCYVIGAKPWETNKPQLWIDKKLYLPARLIEVDKASGSVTDTRLIGIGAPGTGEWFPRRIEVWRDGALVEATTYSSARLNEDVSADLFRPPS
jgi:hypothetical protein